MIRGRRGLPAVSLMPLLIAACYSYTPQVTDRPVPASVIEVTLNDRGRVAMEGNVGPEVLTIEGSVMDVSDSVFVLSVRRVTGIDGNMSRWAGEPVTFRLENIRHVRQRRFSTGRTALLVGTATASALAFVASGSLLPGIFGDRNPPAGGGGPDPDN